MDRAYRQLTRATGLVVSGLGVAMMTLTLVRGGGPLALGFVLGLVFTLLGAGRAFIARERA